MHSSIKLPLSGLLVAGAMVFSSVAAEAGGCINGPDGFIGIIGGNPQPYHNTASGYVGDYPANASPGYPSGWGNHDGVYHTGY
jgi:hypothetical protein